MTTHVRVLTPVTSTQIRSDADIEALQGPDLIVSHDLNDIGPPSIESRFDEAFAIPGLLTKGMAAEREGVDAIVIDCMADPGLNALREAVNIPVLGPLETCVHLAAMMGTQFSIITVLESVRPMFEDLVRSYGVADRLASIRVITVPVLELFGDEERVQALLIREAKLAVEEDGASVLILGCTGFYGCADAMSAAAACQKTCCRGETPVARSTAASAASSAPSILGKDRRSWGWKGSAEPSRWMSVRPKLVSRPRDACRSCSVESGVRRSQ